MKKLCFLSLVLISSCFAVFADETSNSAAVQTAHDSTLFISNKFSKNWELYVHVGAQNYLGEYTRANTFNDMWCPGIDLNINKWASPYFGFGLGANFAGYKGLYGPNDMKAIYAEPSDEVYNKVEGSLRMADGAYGNVFAKAMFNATNLLFGYNPKRIFELTGYLGGGVFFPIGEVSYHSLGSSFNAGLNFQFRLSKRLLADLSVRGALISDGYNGISYLSSSDHDNITLDGMIGATAGIAYKFGYVNRKNQKTGQVYESEWVSAVTAAETSSVVAAMVAEAVGETASVKDRQIEEISDKAAEASAEVRKLREQNAELKSQLEASKKDFWIHIGFKLDRWAVSNNEKVDLMSAAEYIKSCPGQKFHVRGYADKQTASPKHNLMLSTNRANAVRDILTGEFGVDPDQLTVEYCGGVDYIFFDDQTCSRSVIISTK